MSDTPVQYIHVNVSGKLLFESMGEDHRNELESFCLGVAMGEKPKVTPKVYYLATLWQKQAARLRRGFEPMALDRLVVETDFIAKSLASLVLFSAAKRRYSREYARKAREESLKVTPPKKSTPRSKGRFASP